jgi:hypothetical protein
MPKRKEPPVEIEFSRLCMWAVWAKFAYIPEFNLMLAERVATDVQKAIDEYKAKIEGYGREA